MYKLRTLFILIFALTISILTFSKSKPETSSDNFYELKKINQIVIKNNDSEKKQNYFPQNHLSQINKKFKNKIIKKPNI